MTKSDEGKLSQGGKIFCKKNEEKLIKKFKGRRRFFLWFILFFVFLDQRFIIVGTTSPMIVVLTIKQKMNLVSVICFMWKILDQFRCQSTFFIKDRSDDIIIFFDT